MNFFGPQENSYPKKWQEMSFDYKLFFVYFGGMAILFLLGSILSVLKELIIAGILVAVLVSLSVERRRRMAWLWPGVGIKSVLQGLVSIALGIVFLVAASPLFPPSNPTFLPWYLGGLGIFLFAVLQSLRIVQIADSEFLRHCKGGVEFTDTSTPQAPFEPLWKRGTRVVFTVISVAVWLGGMAYFYFFGVYFSNGSPTPTTSHTNQLFSHGWIVYITSAQERLLNRLNTVMAIGIPMVIAVAFLLQFVAKVKIFPNMPTAWEKFIRRKPKK